MPDFVSIRNVVHVAACPERSTSAPVEHFKYQRIANYTARKRNVEFDLRPGTAGGLLAVVRASAAAPGLGA